MARERNASRWREPRGSRPEVRLARQTEQWWALTDGETCITAPTETFVEVER